MRIAGPVCPTSPHSAPARSPCDDTSFDSIRLPAGMSARSCHSHHGDRRASERIESRHQKGRARPSEINIQDDELGSREAGSSESADVDRHQSERFVWLPQQYPGFLQPADIARMTESPRAGTRSCWSPRLSAARSVCSEAWRRPSRPAAKVEGPAGGGSLPLDGGFAAPLSLYWYIIARVPAGLILGLADGYYCSPDCLPVERAVKSG